MDFNNLNMADMFGKMAEMQQKMEEAQASLAKQATTTEVGGGMVKVTVNGKMQVTAIKIDPSIVDATDVEMLEDLVIAGVNKALEEAATLARNSMQSAAGLPGGLDLDSLGLGDLGKKFGF